MKLRSILLAVAVLGLSVHSFARDFKTLSGTVYRNVTVTKVLANGISVSYADGVAFIKFTELPPAVAREFGYNEAVALEADRRSEEQQAAIRENTKRVAEEERQKKLEIDLAAMAARIRTAEAMAAKSQAEAAEANARAEAFVAATQQSAPPSIQNRDYVDRGYSTPRYSGGGTVQVRGYTRKDGTYVRPHTRRK